MRPSNAPNYLIALAVILCSAILLAALTFALRGFAWPSGSRTLEIDFRDSTGIRLHSMARYAGARAGLVTRIRYLTEEERLRSGHSNSAVRVTIALAKDVPAIPSDVQARVTAETLLGEKFISLSPGRPGAPPLPSGSAIQGEDAADFERLARSAQAAMDNVSGLLARLNTDYPNLVPRLSDLLAHGDSLLVQGSNFVEKADGALTNVTGLLQNFKTDYGRLVSKAGTLLSEATNLAGHADLAIQQINSFANRADTLIKTNESDFHEILAELRVVSQNLKVVSTYAKTLAATLAERPSRLIWGFKRSRLPAEQEILQSPQPLPLEPSRK